MIYVVGNAPDSDQYKLTNFQHFKRWITGRTRYQLDVETNVTPWWSTKELITIQFGSSSSQEDTQFVLQWSYLSTYEKDFVRRVLEDPTSLKIIHNALFEIVVLRFHGIEIENVYDTMLMEMVLTGGISDEEGEQGTGESFSLKAVVEKRLGQVLSKEEQTTFGDDELTESKVLYAAQDVIVLHPIMIQQQWELEAEDLVWVAALENEVVLSYAEMTFHGLELDQDMWRSNIGPAYDLVKEAETRLNHWFDNEPFRSVGIANGFLSETDRVLIKWTNPNHRFEMLKLMFEDLPGASLPVVKKYAKERYAEKTIEEIEADPEEYYKATILESFLKKGYDELQQFVLSQHREDLIKAGLIIPAGEFTINWNSTAQALLVLVQAERKLKDLSKESLAKTTHEIIKDYQEYKQNAKLVSSYGEAFITKFVEPDGKVRTTFNQVLTTGRISSKRPNLQNIPAKESVGNRYRNCFMAPKDWVFVDSDYNSQELVIIAHLSKDPVWIKALKNNEDLHSVCAELVYGKRWKDVAEPNCAYYALDANGEPAHKKCSCKKHKPLRTGTKTIDFGLAYGMSEFKLAGELKITVKEAKELIKDYFRTFPAIEKMLQILGRFGVMYGYSKTMSPFFRKRWYPFWEVAKRFIPSHVKGIEYNSTLGSIERQAKNAPIQGSASDMIKLATVFIRWYIKDNKLSDYIHFATQVHDQNTTVAARSHADMWSPILTEKMEEAARVFIPSGLLGSETNITERWSK